MVHVFSAHSRCNMFVSSSASSMVLCGQGISVQRRDQQVPHLSSHRTCPGSCLFQPGVLSRKTCVASRAVCSLKDSYLSTWRTVDRVHPPTSGFTSGESLVLLPLRENPIKQLTVNSLVGFLGKLSKWRIAKNFIRYIQQYNFKQIPLRLLECPERRQKRTGIDKKLMRGLLRASKWCFTTAWVHLTPWAGYMLVGCRFINWKFSGTMGSRDGRCLVHVQPLRDITPPWHLATTQRPSQLPLQL